MRSLVLLAVAMATPSLSHAQELPREALRVTLDYYRAAADARGERLSVDIAGFPDAAVAASVARELGLRFGMSSDVKQCDEVVRRCDIIDAERLLTVRDFRVTSPGREIDLQVILSVEVEVASDESPRTFFSLRQVTLRNQGGWTVTGDEVLAQG